MLSKSKFTRGINCQKSLWLYFHKYEERLVDEGTQTVFAQGTDVGELARQYFPDGKMAVLEDYPSFESAKRTMEFIEQGVETIYEATFIFKKTIVAVDLLKKIDGEWHLFEVKSTNSVKDPHFMDVAIQYHVVTGCGLPLKDVSVMHMNREYIRQGELDIQQLFTYESILPQVLELQEYVAENIELLLPLETQEEEPIIEMGNHCDKPYPCDFKDYCYRLLPVQPATAPIELSHEAKINQAPIKEFLDEIGYPLYFLDFETFMPCVPMFDNSRPYQQLCFQYSLHYKSSREGELVHYEYLAEVDEDPRIKLIEQLIKNTEKPGIILVYNIAFERTRLREMKRDFPQFSEALGNIIDRLVDLMPIFRRQHYVTESMEGRYSIKKVLPALCPALSYDNLDISEGGAASAAFFALYDENDQEIINKTREDLLKYCCLDTLAMVRIVEVLEKC